MLKVDTKEKQGNIHQSARVFTNDPQSPELTIAIKGNVWAPIHVHPKHAHLRGTLAENSGTVVRLKSQKQEPLTLKLVSVSIPEKVDVELKETVKGKIWELHVKNKISQPTRYRGQVKLSTNYPEKPQLVIPISGNIRPSIEAKPKV